MANTINPKEFETLLNKLKLNFFHHFHLDILPIFSSCYEGNNALRIEAMFCKVLSGLDLNNFFVQESLLIDFQHFFNRNFSKEHFYFKKTTYFSMLKFLHCPFPIFIKESEDRIRFECKFMD